MSSIPIRVERTVQQALIDYAYKHRISTLYAVHCNLYKSLRSEGFLDEDTYQRLMAKFSSTLVVQEEKPLSSDELKRKQYFDEQNRLFRSVIEQWDLTHQPGWKERWITEAEKKQDIIPEAKRLLEKVADKVFIK